jgi:hypothetical protein
MSKYIFKCAYVPYLYYVCSQHSGSSFTSLKAVTECNRRLNSEVKGEVVPVPFLNEHHAKKAYWGSEGIAPRIL